MIQALKGSAQAVAQGLEILDPRVAAERFSANFREAYGMGGPQWVECSWQEAAAQAHREFKFLFVYLHSAEHQVCPFCLSIS